MTVKEYIDEIKLRLNRLGVTKSLNDALILSYLNKARRDVQIATMSIMPERYGRRDVIQLSLGNNTFPDPDTMQHLYHPTMPIDVYRFRIPADYIEIVSLVLSGYELGRREARKLVKPELHNIKTHGFNLPVWDRPIYVHEFKQQDYFANVDNWCYIAGVRKGQSLIFDIDLIAVEIWAIVALADFDMKTEQEPVLSPDLEEYAIKQAMLYCTHDVEHVALYQSLKAQTEQYGETIMQNYTMMIDEPIQQLPSEEQ